MSEFKIDSKLSIDKNASLYFEEAKKSRKKAAGAEETIALARKKLEAHEDARKENEEKKLAEVKREKKWFEKFRWFVSSEGFLVIGGRDATTNDIIVKKHLDKDDIAFHTDLAGSPFVIVKTKERPSGKNTAGKSEEKSTAEAPEIAPTIATLQEAAEETSSFSRGWKMGVSEMDVFYVSPGQVSVTARPGEYMGKGSFMIYGKRNTLRAKMRVAAGIYDGALMCGPESAVRKNCEKIIVIAQGSEKKTDVAKKIAKALSCRLDDVVRELPSGGLRIVK
jgi:predicted ribosome quality control (RQC) complex YloA/Tae2 family protein